MAKKKPRLRTWSEFKHELFKDDPELAYGYLRASFEENADLPGAIIEAIRSVSEALDMPLEKIAKKAKIQTSTIYKALGKDGNPTLQTLSAILDALGFRLTIEKKVG